MYHIEPTVAWTLCNASIMFLCNLELKNFNYCPKLIIQQYYKRIKRNHRRKESIKKNIFNLCVWFNDIWLLLHFAYCESSRKRLSEFIFRWYICLSGCVFIFANTKAQPFFIYEMHYILCEKKLIILIEMSSRSENFRSFKSVKPEVLS